LHQGSAIEGEKVLDPLLQNSLLISSYESNQGADHGQMNALSSSSSSLSLAAVATPVSEDDLPPLTFTAPFRSSVADQNNMCLSCLKQLPKSSAFSSSSSAPRCLCCGKYYCEACMAAEPQVLPHRLVSVLDSKRYKTCKKCTGAIVAHLTVPTVDVGRVNAGLYEKNKKLAEIRTLRLRIAELRPFVLSCPQQQLLMLLFEGRKHFLGGGNIDAYSIADLAEVENGKLGGFCRNLQEKLIDHVRNKCEVCKGKGHYCQATGCPQPRQLIFVFDEKVEPCPQCKALFHLSCRKASSDCPKCERIAKLKAMKK
jgi:hypothetical protein